MASPGRRGIPDNLDPLVDTLSNVVGILVVVVALTQIQLGDAIDRVAELTAQGSEALSQAAVNEAAAESSLASRQHALFRRTDVDVEEAIELARRTLEKLESLPPDSIGGAATDSDLEKKLKAAKGALTEKREARNRRAAYSAELERVPKQMVARLPDPVVLQGAESWILVRYGRVFLVDRQELFEEGSQAIRKILPDAGARPVRADEFEAVSRYLRKVEVGFGSFRWLLKTDSGVRVQLAWRTRDTGIDRSELANSRALRAWLAMRSPESDFINFQVWGDSFETYLKAREIVEAAGFRAGWRGHPADEELDLGLSFGPARPPVGPVEVD